MVSLLFQAGNDDFSDMMRCGFADFRFIRFNTLKDLVVVFSIERMTSMEKFVDYDPICPDITRIRVLELGAFGTEIVGRACNRSSSVFFLVFSLLLFFSIAFLALLNRHLLTLTEEALAWLSASKVYNSNLHVSSDYNIFRFQVSVYDPLRVQIIDCFNNLTEVVLHDLWLIGCELHVFGDGL